MVKIDRQATKLSAQPAMSPSILQALPICPTFGMRNIHFCINVCGFYIVEYNPRATWTQQPGRTGFPL